jgi:16S rRNA (cytosine1402-N4)-methyltransferase
VHEPVLVEEVLEGLAVRPGAVILDATVGSGGHAEAILRRSDPDGLLYGFDRDPDAVDRARRRLERFGPRARIARARFSELDAALGSSGVERVDGALLDLGLSSEQIEDASRGFSFAADGPLDMRMDGAGTGRTAADVVRRMPERDLADAIRRYGEDRFARSIAKAIVRARRRGPIARTLELAEIVRAAVPSRARRGRLDPATRTFQALRILVNDEIEELRAALPRLAARLRPGGRLAAISFHSLEDREVKRFFRDEAAAGRLRLLVRRPVRPTPAEVSRNPRSRSARLRIAEATAA